MLGRERVIELLNKLTKEAKKAGAGQAEALYVGDHSSTIRFSDSLVTQNVKESDRTIYFRILLDRRVGVTCTNSMHIDDLRRCMKKAFHIAKQTKPLSAMGFLPEPFMYPNMKTHFPETSEFDISDKIKMLETIFACSRKEGLKAGGAFSTLEAEIGVVNSNSLVAYQPFTSADIHLILSSSSSGFASQFERDARRIDTDKLLYTAMKKALAGKKPVKLKPGKYTVILEPPAVNEIVEWLVYIGFGACSFIDRTSFMSGNINKKIMDKKLTITDDPTDPSGFPVLFDFEGTAKRKMDIIKNGVAKNVAYDTFFAGKRKRKTTGHALIPDDTEGPFPSNIFVSGGEYTIDEMIAMVDRGILVTRFHYVNGLLDTRAASMTGMTRDGTFYIEDGKIRHPVEDMRFAESILGAFSRIEAISGERQAFPAPWCDVGANVVPALMIRGFGFSD